MGRTGGPLSCLEFLVGGWYSQPERSHLHGTELRSLNHGFQAGEILGVSERLFVFVDALFPFCRRHRRYVWFGVRLKTVECSPGAVRMT